MGFGGGVQTTVGGQKRLEEPAAVQRSGATLPQAALDWNI